MQASLLSLVHRLIFLRYRVALRPRLLLFSQRLHILLMILLRLALRILKLPVLQLRCLLCCPTPLALRYAACTSIWWTSSRRLRACRRLLRLLALSLRSSLPLLRLLISLPFLCGLRESALLSLRLTPVSRPCSLVAVRSLHFCLLVTPSNPSVVRLRWAPLLQSILLCLPCLSVLFVRLSISALRSARLHFWRLPLGLFQSPFHMRCGSCQVSWVLCSSRVSLRRMLRFLTRWSHPCPSVWPIRLSSPLPTWRFGLKRHQFYLSHLPAYFTDVHKRAMMAAPLVCADSLFLESDISRLLSDTQTSSSLRSQQALVDVASNLSRPRRRRFSPARPPSRSSPSRRRRRESGSPSRSSKRVRFDSPAPSALKPPNKGFRRQEPCPSSRKVGGCLTEHWEVWKSWGADVWVVQVLRYGHRVPFRSLPPLSHVPIPLPSYSPNSIRGLALSDAVSALVENEAIEIAPPSPGFYSRLFVTPKVTGGWRLVIDLSRLNGWVELPSFHMETVQSVLQSLRPGDWMVSLDLQDAYLQVPIHPASCRYLRFCVGDAVYQFRALCFGLSSAPQVFTRVMAPVSSIMHRHGSRLLRYLDDWLVLGSTFQELVRAKDFLLWLCRLLGIIVNPSKSSLVLTQTGLSRDDARDFSFEGFPDPQTGSEVLSPSSGLFVRPPPSCVGLAESSRHDVVHVSHSSRISSPHEVSPASPQCGRSSPAQRGSRFLGRWLPQGSSVVVRRLPSVSRSSPRQGPPRSLSLLQRFGPRLGRCSRRPPPLRLVVSPMLALFD